MKIVKTIRCIKIKELNKLFNCNVNGVEETYGKYILKVIAKDRIINLDGRDIIKIFKLKANQYLIKRNLTLGDFFFTSSNNFRVLEVKEII